MTQVQVSDRFKRWRTLDGAVPNNRDMRDHSQPQTEKPNPLTSDTGPPVRPEIEEIFESEPKVPVRNESSSMKSL